jgi:SAM-dependent methyltransferase
MLSPRSLIGQRLAEGFAQVSERVDRDIGILADQIGQLIQRYERDLGMVMRDLGILAGRIGDCAEATRLTTSVVAKLAVGQSELGERLRSLQSSAIFRSAVTASPSTGKPARHPVLERLAQVSLPEEIRVAIRDDEAWCLLPALMPSSADALPQIIEVMRTAREQLRPGERLLMVQPPATTALLNRDETEQVLGLLGPVQTIREVATPQGTWRVAAAEAKIENFAFALRWSIGPLEEFHLRSSPIFKEALARFKLLDSLHGIELPRPNIEFDYWAQLVQTFCRLLADVPDAEIGIVLPADFERRSDLFDRAVGHVRSILQKIGNGADVSFQWASGSLSLAQSEALLAFARRHAIPCDFSPVNRQSHESRLAAYDDLSAYYPLAFDLRVPSFAQTNKEPIEVPRWSGRSLAVAKALGLQAPGTLAEEFDRDFEQSCRRLTLVLDRRGQGEFQRLSNFDPALIPELWPGYFVYNWPPPPCGRLRLFEFDASELLSEDSPLVRFQLSGGLASADLRRASARQFLRIARQLAVAVRHADLDQRDIQIEAHEYLHARHDVTADAEELISWMPARLGTTLELGCGYGVMARRVSDRADLYVGFDLTVEQARALGPNGGVGLVADMHHLPFPNEKFDTIIADNVVEHAYDPLQTLSECCRVLRPGGRAFLIIPPDYLGPAFRNRAHFWKSDEASVAHAVELAGFRVIHCEMIRMAEIGVTGAHPSSKGVTSLWHIEKPATSAAREIRFDLAEARNYWRHAPSGAGKHDTSNLLALDDQALREVWDNAFLKRFERYPEEDQFLRHMAAEFAGKRVLSIGSGIGLHEIFYQLHGARMTCCDIVPSNLEVIRRISAIKGARGMEFLVSKGSDQDLGGPYDVIFIYGSLMTMPIPLQRELLAGSMAALRPDGRIVLMLYTWEFARATCTWSSRDEFDPRVFARASDPSVGPEHCPWSDWHDDAKLEALVGGEMLVRRRQFWNQDWFVWHELARVTRTGEPTPFFQAADLLEGAVAKEFALGELQAAEAEITGGSEGLEVETRMNNFGYALMTQPFAVDEALRQANQLLVDADLSAGAFSLGVLDEDRNEFIATAPIWKQGRSQFHMAIPRMPSRCRLIISNHRTGQPGSSRFKLHRLVLLRTPRAVPSL